MKSLIRLFCYEGYEVLDTQYSSRDSHVLILLERKASHQGLCSRCGSTMGQYRGRHRLSIREMDMLGARSEIRLWRHKFHCHQCKKARSERVEFLAHQSSKVTERYHEWIGTMCEFAPNSRVSKFSGNSETRVRNIDYERMKRFLKTYKIPPVTHIAVDEVYARKKKKHKGESREKRFFTVITDLETRRVIWVSESREKAALDEFFELIGKEACSKVKVVAIDQHDGYKASVQQHCSNADVVWDRFHLVKTFNEAVNEERKTLHAQFERGSRGKELSRSKYKYIFLKKPERLSKKEQSHIDQIYLENSKFSQLDIIKEFFYSFFEQQSEVSALDTFSQLGLWIDQAGFTQLKKWYRSLERNWDTLKNYFAHRVTSALAEGTNNVIKALKRRAYGYRNMDYFRLKIMQVCGYLNSEWAGKHGLT